MLKKLRIKIIVFSAGLAGIMLLALLLMVCQSTAQRLEQESIVLMQQLARRPLPEIMERPGDRPQDLHLPYFVVERNGIGELSSAAGGYYDLSDGEFISQVVELALESGDKVGVLKEYSLRYSVSESPIGKKLVFVDISSEQSALRSLGLTVTLIFFAGLLGFFGLGLLLAHYAVKPVELAWERQRGFVADASHELKTPLTVIMTNAEMLASGDYSDIDTGRFAGNILAMSRQMRGLVEGMLELARVDRSLDMEQAETLELDRLLGDAVLPFEPLFFEKGLSLRTDIEENIPVRGNARQLEQLLDILLDNAMKYCSLQGEVSLVLRRHGSHALLSVSNPGQAMSRQEMKDIFLRFYRLDRVRSMNGSYGLGLPIARGIVSAHRGRIWAESGEGIVRFHVLLPLA